MKLSVPASVGDTTVTVDSPLLAGQGRYNGYVVIDAYTTEAELRRVVAQTATSLTLSAPLSYSHGGGDTVLWHDGGLIPWTWFGAKQGSTSYAADNVLAFNRACKAQYDLGGGSNSGTAGVLIPQGVWYVNDQLRPERDQTIKGLGPTKSQVYAASGFPFGTTGEVAIIHPQHDGIPVGFQAINNTTRCYIEDLYVSGAKLANACGVLLKVQQPNIVRNLRIDDCPGLYGLCVMGQDGEFDNLELLGHATPLLLRGAQLMKFRNLNIEKTTGTANVVIGDAYGGYWIGFDCVHFEPFQETIGFDVRNGASGLAVRDMYYANPITGTAFRFDTPQANPGGACRYVLTNVWCNQPSQTFKIVDDIQRGKSITSWNTDSDRWIDQLTPRDLVAGYTKSP